VYVDSVCLCIFEATCVFLLNTWPANKVVCDIKKERETGLKKGGRAHFGKASDVPHHVHRVTCSALCIHVHMTNMFDAYFPFASYFLKVQHMLTYTHTYALLAMQDNEKATVFKGANFQSLWMFNTTYEHHEQKPLYFGS